MLLVSCGVADRGEAPASTPVTLPTAAPAPPLPDLDEGLVAAGERLYQPLCASCHGIDLAGEPDWKARNADGSFRAPPHDSTGHTWHHSDSLLVEIIGEGIGVPNSAMPTYGELLTAEEIVSIVEYLKSTWGPDERTFQWQVTWQESQRSS